MYQEIKYNISLDIEENNNKFFRYSYTKCWNENKRRIIAILFNPSKATLTRSDGTIDILTDYFFKDYGEMVVLNLFSYMCSNPKDMVNTEKKYEIKNWKKVMEFLEAHKSDDFFIGWGTDFKNVEKRSKEYIEGHKILDTKRQEIIRLANDIEKYAISKKDKLEKFFINNKMQERIFCFWSKNKDKKSYKALHPSKYDSYGENWTYKEYF